jgi:predicted Zn-ribbon and HTH transcriptional regulator
MITEENDLRFRNARMRGKIVDLLAHADAPTRLRVRSIVERQAASATNNAIESLKEVHENLRMRAAELVRAGIATPEDFRGL